METNSTTQDAPRMAENAHRIHACQSHAMGRESVLEFQLALATRRGEFREAAPRIMREIASLNAWIAEMGGNENPATTFRPRHGKDCKCHVCSEPRFSMPAMPAAPRRFPINAGAFYPAAPLEEITTPCAKAIRSENFKAPAPSCHVKNESLSLSAMQAGDSPTLAPIAATVIRRLNFPKALCGKARVYARDSKRGKAGEVTKAEREKSLSAKAHKLLSPQDELEVFQTCALVLHARGEFFSATIERATWFHIFRECRKALGVDRKRETLTETPADEIADLMEAAHNSYDAETAALARVKLARRVKYWHSCIAKAREISTSRKRRAAWKNQLATLRAIAAGSFAPRQSSQLEMQAYSKAKARLMEAVEAGEAAFDMEAESAIAESRDSRAKARALELEASMLALW